MNVFTYRIKCAICGGDGVAHNRHYGTDWFGQNFVHKDSSICVAEIQRKTNRKQTENQQKTKQKILLLPIIQDK